MIGKLLSFLSHLKKRVKPGLLFALIIIIYTVFFNISLTYMGNSASGSLSILLNNFLFSLIIVVIKIAVTYLVLFSFLCLFFRYGLDGIAIFFHKTLGETNREIIIFLLITVMTFLQLGRAIINYPQMFIDSFYIKNSVYAYIQEFLTDNINPYMIAVVQISLMSVFSTGLVYRIIKMKSVKDFMHAYSGRAFAVMLFFIAVFLSIKHAGTFYTKRTETANKNLIIISSDALRPDHFSSSGYSRDTTPSIDRFLERSIVASNMYAVTPRTFPSWVSILSSQYPETHTIVNMFPSSSNRNRELITIATILSNLSYRTSVVGDFAADIFPRMKLGFENVKTPTFNSSVLIEQIILKSNLFILPYMLNRFGVILFPSIREFAEFADPSLVTSDVVAEIDKARNSGRPFFITAFFSVTHFPFSSPWPYYKRYTDTKYSGPSKYMKNRVISIGSGKNNDGEMDKRDIEHVRALYDGCLNGFDDSFSEIIEHLKKKDLLKNTIVVLLSDHGENLYEFDNGMGHGEHLRGKWSVKIPFAVMSPDIKPATIHEARSIVDVAPTILDFMGVKIPESFEGRSILKKLNREFNAYMETGLWFDTQGNFFFQKDRLYYPDITGISAIEFDYNKEVYVSGRYKNLTKIARHRAIVSGNYKLIYMPTKNGIKYELYNIKTDPDERINIYSMDRNTAERMKRVFYKYVSADSGTNVINGYLVPVFDEPVF